MTQQEFNRTMRSLTVAQKRVLGCVAINQDQFHHPKVLKALEDRGLILGHDRVLGGGVPVRVREYHVPQPLHMFWCAYCARGKADAL